MLHVDPDESGNYTRRGGRGRRARMLALGMSVAAAQTYGFRTCSRHAQPHLRLGVAKVLKDRPA